MPDKLTDPENFYINIKFSNLPHQSIIVKAIHDKIKHQLGLNNVTENASIDTLIDSIIKKIGSSECGGCFFQISTDERVFEQLNFEKLQLFVQEFEQSIQAKKGPKCYFFWNVELLVDKRTSITNLFSFISPKKKLKKSITELFYKNLSPNNNLFLLNDDADFIPKPDEKDIRQWGTSIVKQKPQFSFSFPNWTNKASVYELEGELVKIISKANEL